MGKLKKNVPHVVKQKNPRNKRNKTTLVFDEKARQDYLTGFSKRKAERKRVGHEQVIAGLKEEKRQLKKKRREELNEKWEKLNLQTDLDSLSTSTTYNLEKHTVTVSDISEVDLAGSMGSHLGVNQFKPVSEEPTKQIPKSKKQNPEESSCDEEEEKEDESSKKKSLQGKERSKKWKNHHKNLTHLMSKQSLAKNNKRNKKLEKQGGPQQRVINKKKQMKTQKKRNANNK